MLRALLPACLLLASAQEDADPANISSIRIAACDRATKAPSPNGLPATPCGREDLQRGSLCSLLATPPVPIPAFLTSNARVHPNRHAALLAHVKPAKGAKIVEVGTLYGQLAKWMVHNFEPSNLTVMDVSLRALAKCRDGGGSTRVLGKKYGTAVNCIWGSSPKFLGKLENDMYDLIYVDGDHAYKGVCADLEAARSKVRVGGLLALNDYYRFEWQFLAAKGRWGAYGVVHAANEFLVRYQTDWELAYLTFGPEGEVGDFGMRRIR